MIGVLMLLTALAPLAAVQAAPDEASEYYYGVEYDWTSLDSDLQNVTGLDVQELFTEIMEDADNAGFNLDLGQLTTGSTNVYVHQTEDISAQTVENLNGTDVQVWSRTSNVTLRHGVLSNAIIMTDWSETTFGSNTTSFDVGVVATAENVLTVDILYTEYLNDAYELVGADMNIDMTVGADLDLGVDISLEGGGEDLNVDFDTGIDFTYSIASDDAEWRLGQPSPIYIQAAQNDHTQMFCVDDAEDVEVVIEGSGDAEIHDLCGELSGTFAGTADYELSLTGLPTEEFGLDAGEFDITVSDNLAESGNYQGDADELDGTSFSMRSDTPLQVDLGDGTNLNVVACDTCPPGSPMMFAMMGGVLAQASGAFGEAVAEELEANIEDSLADVFEDLFGIGNSAEGNSMDNGDTTPMFTCDDGDLVRLSDVNDGYEDCNDGSDEEDFFVNVNTYSTTPSYSFSGTVPHEEITSTSNRFDCGDGTDVPWSSVNDGVDDCGENVWDETMYSPFNNTVFECADGTEIDYQAVNDGVGDCSGFEDEGVSGLYTVQVTLTDEDGNVLADVNDYTLCDDYSLCNNTGYSSYLYFSLPNSVEQLYGDNTLCVESSLTNTTVVTELGVSGLAHNMSSSVMHTSAPVCKTSYTGPNAFGNMYIDGMTMTANANTYDFAQTDDATLHLSITNNQDVEIWSGTQAFDGTESPSISHEMDLSEEGEYCMEVSMVQDGQTEAFWSNTQCDDATTVGTPSDRLETIVEALADSGLVNVLETFGENLEDTFTTFEEDTETPEFPYVDGMWAPLWSNEKATIVGVAVYGYDDDDNGYLITGPATTDFSEELPMTFASIRYVTGVPAMEAQVMMVEANSLADIVDVEDHDLTQLEDALVEAGVDVSDLDLTPGTDSTDEDETSTEQTAEELAEEDGLLPFLSPLSMMAVLGLAFVAFNTRREHDE
ncbi:MAG: hypothetical protein DWC07_00665 [Candidatus Poseidoniales archaeon]|nr:MAG: hypothetical protein DWC07_00665 [Candidatus Poseidoniales archaeon]